VGRRLAAATGNLTGVVLAVTEVVAFDLVTEKKKKKNHYTEKIIERNY
jgi:hypothetical protein